MSTITIPTADDCAALDHPPTTEPRKRVFDFNRGFSGSEGQPVGDPEQGARLSFLSQSCGCGARLGIYDPDQGGWVAIKDVEIKSVKRVGLLVKQSVGAGKRVNEDDPSAEMSVDDITQDHPFDG